jgi:uncharacterized membrane protein
VGTVILIDDWQRKISSFFVSKKFHIILIFVGIVLRLKHYFENRSFWLDESWVALSIFYRNFKEILLSVSLSPDLPDTRPPGFSLITKLFTVSFGDHEFIFRLLPLLSGILALILFYFLIRRYLNSEAISVALGLFVFCDSLVYYSAEFKQYSSDVLCVLSVYLLFEYVRQKKYEYRYVRLLGIMGIIIIWFSITSLFVLVAIGLTCIMSFCFHKQWEDTKHCLLMTACWLASFSVLYKICIAGRVGNKILTNMWGWVFPPIPLWSIETVKWLGNVIMGAFRDPLGLSFPIFAAFVFICGCISSLQ